MPTKLGIDLIWFGVLIGANMQTSFMHPPFGFALFYLRGVAPPEIKTTDIYLRRDPVGLPADAAGGDPDLLPGNRDEPSLDKPPTIDPNSIQQLDIPSIEDVPPLDLEPPKIE